MPRPCHQKNKEVGLWFEIKCIKENIALKEKLGKDVSFEKRLLKSFQRYSGRAYASQGIE